MRFALLLTAAVSLGACASPTSPEDPANQLQLNRERWSSAGIASYRFTLTRSCECTPEMAGPVVIEVEQGLVVSRRYEWGSAVDPQFADLFATVPGLFDLIEAAILLPAASVSVRYDASLGYPRSIAIDQVAGVVDDEVSYRVSDFIVLSD